jgi:hypothetical protein
LGLPLLHLVLVGESNTENQNQDKNPFFPHAGI